jgi:hypothetical protein
MRFRENGADIPAELLNAVSNGDTIFLCGAGVSKRAGLPLFDELPTTISRRGSYSWASHQSA